MTVFFRVSGGDLSQGVMHLGYKTKSPTEIPKAPRSSRLTVDGYGVQKSKHFYPVVSTPSPTAAEAKLETQSWVNSPPPPHVVSRHRYTFIQMPVPFPSQKVGE